MSNPGASASNKPRSLEPLERPAPLRLQPTPGTLASDDVFANLSNSGGLSGSGVEAPEIDPSKFIFNTSSASTSEPGQTSSLTGQDSSFFSKPSTIPMETVSVGTVAETKTPLTPPQNQDQTLPSNAISNSGQASNNSSQNNDPSVLVALAKSNTDLIRQLIGNATRETIDKKITNGPFAGMRLSTVVAINGDPELMKAILEKNADPIRGTSLITHHEYLYGTSIPFLCILFGNEAALEIFLEHTLKNKGLTFVMRVCCTDVATGIYKGGTALEAACFKSSVTGTELLLKYIKQFLHYQRPRHVVMAIYRAICVTLNTKQWPTQENTERSQKIIRLLMKDLMVCFSNPADAFMGLLKHAVVVLALEKNFVLAEIIKTLLEAAPEGSANEIQKYLQTFPQAKSEQQKQIIVVLNEYLSRSNKSPNESKTETKLDAAETLLLIGKQSRKKHPRDESETELQSQQPPSKVLKTKHSTGSTVTFILADTPMEFRTLPVGVQTSISSQTQSNAASNEFLSHPTLSLRW